MTKTERYGALERKVWDNLQSTQLLSRLIAANKPATQVSDYASVLLWFDFRHSNHFNWYGMFVSVIIGHREEGLQPLQTRLYLLTDSVIEQADLSRQIWDG